MNASYTIKAEVLGLSRYAMDNGIKGANVFIVQDSAGKSENRLGREVMTAKADYEIFEDFRDYEELLPGEFELDMQMRPGAKASLTMYVAAVRPVPAAGKQSAGNKAPEAPAAASTKS